MTKNDIIALADKIASGVATDDEIAAYNTIFNGLQEDSNAWNGNREKMETRLRERISRHTQEAPVRRIRWRRWAAAAAVLVVLLGAGWLYLFRPLPAPAIALQPKKTIPAAEIVPGRNMAILTLADGSTVVLDSAANGTISQQGNIKVLKLNGQLQYAQADNKTLPAEMVYNTISTPRGGQYQVILADGTKVWLNAASSLRYPASFAGATRDVEITGEAYFEVAQNKTIPFRVKAGGSLVQVLGTHFNINAYDDENTVSTTLLEGSVKVIKNNAVAVLTPGEQAQLDKNGHLALLHDVNVEEVTAWKDGFFQFNYADLSSVMRQLSRWYDVDVEYKGQPDASIQFNGKLGRDLRLQQVLKVLQRSEVNFNIQGRKIIVIP
jgi:ferric-dicitrate binding protein FerR (iron transport regulator)